MRMLKYLKSLVADESSIKRYYLIVHLVTMGTLTFLSIKVDVCSYLTP